MYNCIVIYLPFRLTCEIYFMSIFLPKYPCPRESMVEIFRVPTFGEFRQNEREYIIFFTVSDGFYYFLPSLFRAPLSINLAKNTLNAPPPFFISPLCFSGTVTLFDFSSFFLFFFFFSLCCFQLYFSNVCDFCFQWEKNKISSFLSILFLWAY